MGILTGQEKGIKLLAVSDFGFIGALTNHVKGLYLIEIHQYTVAVKII